MIRVIIAIEVSPTLWDLLDTKGTKEELANCLAKTTATHIMNHLPGRYVEVLPGWRTNKGYLYTKAQTFTQYQITADHPFLLPETAMSIAKQQIPNKLKGLILGMGIPSMSCSGVYQKIFTVCNGSNSKGT